MTEKTPGTVVTPEPAQWALRMHFLGWQCRVRQYAVRQAGGRPSPGMRPYVSLPGQGEPLGQITTLIVKREPQELTSQLRFMAKKTHDPAERYDAALKLLAAYHYQRPEEFTDELTALFGLDSKIAGHLSKAGGCTLDFEQYNQRYHIPCTVRDLPESDPLYQATYWHNSLFNPALPGAVCILGFRPQWAAARADPPIG